MKNKKPKSKINKWKLTAIISLAVNGIVALLLTIGLATPKSYVKASADFEYSYDTSKIITSPNSIRNDTDYYLYFDWENQSVEGDEYLYYFPISNSVTPFSVYIARSVNVGGYNATYFIEKTSLGGDFRFACSYQGRDYNIGIIRNDIEPPSMFLSFEDLQSCPNYSDIVASFKSLFNGSIPINTDTIKLYRSSEPQLYKLDFIIGYFSQYSVQNLQIGVYDDSSSRLKNIDFEALYSFDRPLQHNSYKYLANNFIVTTNQQRLFGDDEGHDWGYMNALDGIFKYSIGYDNNYCSSLYFVWKPIEAYQLQNFNNVVVDGFLITSGISNNYYYYLDSLCPYDVANEQVLIDSPLVVFHKDEMSYNTTLNQPDNTLRMTSGVYLQNPVLTLLKINLYPSQTQKWSMFNYLFRTINHFYFNSGSPLITEPTQNDIENSTNNITGVFALISGAFESLIPLLSIMVLPNITLGVLIFIPLILTIIIVVIKLVKR